jgi:hypothetical protein
MPDSYKNQLLKIAAFMVVCIPIVMYSWVGVSYLNDWDVVFTARAAALSVMIILFICILMPLFVIHSKEARLQGFIVFWFCLSAFFNLVWQLPLILFKSIITSASLVRENLPLLIPWWGYGLSDSHYGSVTPAMVSEEVWWLLANAVAVTGLVLLHKSTATSRKAYLYLGVAGALQAYNASLYIVGNGLIDSFRNIAPGSTMALILYWGFNLFWTFAALAASLMSFRYVLGESGEQCSDSSK